MFTAYPTYYRYRGLKLQTPLLHGEDVYALQTALIACGFPLPISGADGYLGRESSQAIVACQKAWGLVQDGVAGPVTQRALALHHARKVVGDSTSPLFLSVKGQLQHESGYFLGNYSSKRDDPEAPQGWSYDAGVAQQNTRYTPPKVAFTTPDAIAAMVKVVRDYYVLFQGVTPNSRRWDLAQAAWNAPAFACYLAKQEGATHVLSGQTRKPDADDLVKLNAYIASVSVYR